jgi:hypothetical protein
VAWILEINLKSTFSVEYGTIIVNCDSSVRIDRVREVYYTEKVAKAHGTYYFFLKRIS